MFAIRLLKLNCQLKKLQRFPIMCGTGFLLNAKRYKRDGQVGTYLLCKPWKFSQEHFINRLIRR